VQIFKANTVTKNIGNINIFMCQFGVFKLRNCGEKGSLFLFFGGQFLRGRICGGSWDFVIFVFGIFVFCFLFWVCVWDFGGILL